MILTLFTLHFFQVFHQSTQVFVEDIIAEGPGFDPSNIVLPVRYFFIQTNRSEKLNPKLLEINVSGFAADQRPCRLWKQILDRRDGSFIVRYKLYETCYNLMYDVKYDGVSGGVYKHPSSGTLQKFPVIFEGPVHPEDCSCPHPNVEEWLKTYNCPPNPRQILNDLRKYPSVDFKIINENAVQRFNNSRSSSVCHYVLNDNKIYRRCYGEHTDFKMFMDATLLSLTRKVVLPNLEFYSNLGDWPLVRKSDSSGIPMFSWCGSTETDDIVMPTYDLTESTLGSMDRVTLDILSVQGNIDKSWNDKEPKAFWRGRDSSPERLNLIEISRKYPDLINASLTNFFFYRNQEEKYGPKVKHISFFKFFDYKYQLCLDGTVAAYRLPYLLAGDSLVLKQDSKYYEYFYSGLEPMKHFVPVKRDLSDLIEKIKWAIENDDKAQEIARSAREYVRENILPIHIFCYYANLLHEWSKRLTSPVTRRNDMEEVPQSAQPKHCSCTISVPRKDEL